ncbi:MAG: methionine--tRNA ligase [Anaerocolumna sp.]|jgi:methionyl-tRNA synthetase|nr:methionine--tRNA ligase [Anaerocolumna sp.]
MKNILIGGAWPYANGSLHIGHIASLLPGDVLARYYRAKGDQVFYVSGSDCHGTPVAIRAKQEKKSPEEISNFYHNEFDDIFKKLGFSYDLYTKTTSKEHKDFVRDFHKKLYESNLIYEKTAPGAFCPKCNKVVTDRLVIGECPLCGAATRGDQCDNCGAVLEPESIVHPKCADCNSDLNFIESTGLYIALSKLEMELTTFVENHPKWRKNAISFTKRYIEEGLKDRAITRDLDWGIDVPKTSYENKKIYIWAENVLGYLSASFTVAKQRNVDFNHLWSDNSLHYYVHGKDNIPFHTIILPALLIVNGEHVHLPDEIISSEYLTLEGKRISTSQNYAIWAKDIVDRYNPDSLRYFFITNGPEKRDTDFSWREFVTRNNSELLGAYGNFINRTLAFINKYLNNIVPVGILEEEIREKIQGSFKEVGTKIEQGQFKDAIDSIFDLVRFGNKYFDEKEPWKTRTSDIIDCNNSLFNCVQIVGNLAVLLHPFLPFSSRKVLSWLSLNNQWETQFIKVGYLVPEVEILFERLDKSVIDFELKRLVTRA